MDQELIKTPRILLNDVRFKAGSGHMVATIENLELSGPGIYGVIGLGLAGKSNLLATLAKVQRPLSGQVVPITGHNKERYFHEHGYLYQQMIPYGIQTVESYLRFEAYERGMKEASTLIFLKRTLMGLGIEALLKRSLVSLSFPEKRMVCLAGVTIHRPAFLYLDEIYHGLDDEHVIKVNGYLRTLAKRSMILLASGKSSLLPALKGALILFEQKLFYQDLLKEPSERQTHTLWQALGLQPKGMEGGE